MKKFIPYLLIIIGLAGAAIWYKVHNSPEAVKEREGDFAYKQTDKIGRIVIQGSNDNKQATLTAVDGHWVVNGKYEARPELISQLLEAVAQLTSLAPVPSNAHDNVLREMMASNIHVQIYDRDNNLVKEYMVGGASVDKENTYMLLYLHGEPASRPHLVYIPGFRGYVSPRFETDEEVWRTRTLFSYTPDQIKSVQVAYSETPENSYTITRVAPDSFSVEAINPKYTINNNYEQKYVLQYLNFFNSISIEAYDNSYSGKDSLLKTIPACVITVVDTANKTNTARLFHMPLNKRSKAVYDLKGNELTYDIDRYYAAIHQDKDFAIVQYFVFGKLMRNYKDFFFKPTIVANP
ncbi:MAG: hypothetical protein U0T75_16800 [Chitinophagales bacterium]